MMSHLDALPNSDVTLARLDSLKIRWTLYDVYKVAPNHSLEMSVLGWINVQTNDRNCGMANGVQLNDAFHRASARKNFKGINFRCGSLVCTL